MKIAAAGVALASLALAAAMPPPPGAEPRIEELAWLAGTWRLVAGEFDGEVLDPERERLEEVWSEPRGGAMMGVFRWDRSEGLRLFELLSITSEEGTLVFRLRHFSPRLAAWEEREAPFVYPLASLRPGRAVFENPQREHPRRFVLARESPDRVRILLETTPEEGDPAASWILYERAR